METAIERLKKMTAWEAEPELTETEVGDLLDRSGIVDAAGWAPSDDDWSPTYDLNSAAFEGWMIKAGRASELTEIDPPDSGVFTSRVFENCLAMARIYSEKRRVAVKLANTNS
ncbi:MAG: hypothetical protein ABI539_08290 [Acidobacteriota bacterium]